MTAVERAIARAAKVLAVYEDEGPNATVVQDLITDLRHYYAAHCLDDLNWDDMLRLVDRHFEAEQAGEDD